jgi:threonine/homoserine/homoserine lactone efflux protein
VTVTSLAALFMAMMLLAAMPSLSVLLVTSKAATSGLRHGACVAAGVVVGDVIFILLAVFGLALVVNVFAGAWLVVKVAAAAYLVWLALGLLRSSVRPDAFSEPPDTSLQGSFMAGLLLTLADQKAIIFYLAFLPVFIDLAALSWVDVAALGMITMIAVGGVKLAYAYAATRAGMLVLPAVGRKLNIVAACALMVTAVVLLLRG